MASSPITSWQIDGETMETSTDFIFLYPEITADGYCSQEIKRCLLLGRKAVMNLDWRFVSYMILYMFQCHSPKSSPPLPQSPKVHSTHLCLFRCLTYRVIITIFLNSIYICQYTVLVFFFLAYFTLYNRLQFYPPHQN